MNKQLLDEAMSRRNPDVTGRYFRDTTNRTGRYFQDTIDHYSFIEPSPPAQLHQVPPTAEKAATDFRHLMVGMQKFKSSVIERLGDAEDTLALMADLHPWIFGPKGIGLLDNLSKALDYYENTGFIDGSFYYNTVVIVNLLAAPFMRGAIEETGYKDFPEEVHPLTSVITLT